MENNTEGYQPLKNIEGLPPGADMNEAYLTQLAESKFKDHTSPDGYHYPNKAVIELMRNAFIEGVMCR